MSQKSPSRQLLEASHRMHPSFAVSFSLSVPSVRKKASGFCNQVNGRISGLRDRDGDRDGDEDEDESHIYLQSNTRVKCEKERECVCVRKKNLSQNSDVA